VSAAVRLLVTAGSARRGSYNAALARVAATLARSEGAEVTELDLRALALPVYDADIEAAGMPVGALELRRLFAGHDAFIVAAPEYNAFVTPLLVNALDWASRPVADGALPSGLAAMNATVAGMLSASPGALGGMRSVLFLRSFLSTALGMLVVPETASVSQSHQAFDAAGALKDERSQQAVLRVVRSVLRTAGAGRGAAG
jgi:chromate reductase, NAD(P)H dehydrogenase (quinone)